MYEVLRRHALFDGCEKELGSLLRNQVSDGTWGYFTGRGEGSYRFRIESAGDEYWERMLGMLAPHEEELAGLARRPSNRSDGGFSRHHQGFQGRLRPSQCLESRSGSGHHG